MTNSRDPLLSAPAESPVEKPETHRKLNTNLRIVSLGTLVSRILGLLRDTLLASTFGAGTALDAFIVAFRIPNLARQLLGEGALSTAFLPIYVKEREERGDDAARATLTAVTVCLCLILLGIVILAELLIWGFPHVWEVPTPTRLLLRLLSILFPYTLLVCISALFCATLHARRRFFWPVTVPILLNLIWLAGLLVAVRTGWTEAAQAQFVAAVVVLAGACQMLVPLVVLQRSGAGLSRHWRPALPRVGEIIRCMLPVVAGLMVIQFNAVLDSLLAWFFSQPDDGSRALCEQFGLPVLMEAGTASGLYLGQRMYQFPLGVFGVALATVLYPILTQHAQTKNWDGLREDLTRGGRLVLAIGLPASVGLIVLARPLVEALFRHGQFDAQDAVLVSRMIRIYGMGVWCYIGLTLLNRAFYAIGDRITPMRLGLVAIVLNLLLNLVFVIWLGGVGLALGSVASAVAQFTLSLNLLNRRLGALNWQALSRSGLLSLLASLVMGLACLVTEWGMGEAETGWGRMGRLFIPLLVGAMTYLLLAWALKLKEIGELLRR